MKRTSYKKIAALAFALVFLSVGTANAQIQAAGGGYYVAGYGRVYGSFGQASVAQSRMYDAVKTQNRRTTEREASIQKYGLAAVEKAERDAASGSSRSNPQIVVPPPPVVHNYGVFRRDLSVQTGTALADALGSTPEEKALIEQIYTSTKTAYEKEAAARGWKNNIAAGLTFFTVAAMTVYHDAGMPSDAAVNTYFKTMNAALDEMPEMATAANKDKQGFNNALVGFGEYFSRRTRKPNRTTTQMRSPLARNLREC
jgi:hypothetical protein